MLTDFLQNASHDEIALWGCLAAFVASLSILYVSQFIRARNPQSRSGAENRNQHANRVSSVTSTEASSGHSQGRAA